MRTVTTVLRLLAVVRSLVCGASSRLPVGTLVTLLFELFESSTSWELDEALDVRGSLFPDFQLNNKVVVCPTFTFLPVAKHVSMLAPWVEDGETPVFNRCDLARHQNKKVLVAVGWVTLNQPTAIFTSTARGDFLVTFFKLEIFIVGGGDICLNVYDKSFRLPLRTFGYHSSGLLFEVNTM